jgi:ABC-type oligopeptide transport system substrate-binding subunit
MPAGPARDGRYAEAEQIILDDAVWVPLYHYTSRALVKASVRGLERSPLSTAPEISVPLRNVWLDR